jgi:hypothetical protein
VRDVLRQGERLGGHDQPGLHVEHAWAGRSGALARERTTGQRAERPDGVGMAEEQHPWLVGRVPQQVGSPVALNHDAVGAE